MAITLAFDVYGTLIDTNGVVLLLQRFIGPGAKSFSSSWRDKQLEYSFRRGLMQNYQSFAVCTRDALDYTCAAYQAPLSADQKRELLDAYRALPAFSDVTDALSRLKSVGFRLFAFSNGSAKDVDSLLVNAQVRDYFLDVISVEDLRSFKPDPAVYHHFLAKAGARRDHAWLISSNPFDVIGAISAGMRAAWVQRSEQSIYDPWGIEPTITVKGLTELCTKIGE